MMSVARCLFLRVQDREAFVALSALVAGVAGSIATLVTVAMMMAGVLKEPLCPLRHFTARLLHPLGSS
ncbi:hypothetical protein A6V36_14025 [Paraburkholderia ginsengiterrae]|uniref:Uncharacterized protein n=1 Tax=Paraburkholderia ginsengiterrae TaxID=1462993 RepID=A0A1A9MZ02_9BURK|nr:hypothetical protein [Paraburkholderia ginsengiterrae]OAJ52519.1 hypothetical protein A6V36_14025 [Paraburkholderia ginsengiterrae]OAJ52605.1 hypothetical protein A6V37_09175 [Paraburkholderia ginsengiterrae]